MDKKDSISIETQTQRCLQRIGVNDTYKVYSDKGFSGKNTERPAFTKMMNDVSAGKIDRIIVYKLDRLSRSLFDFVNLMKFFDSAGVVFLSAEESFDTSGEMGRAMLGILMVFAQYERECIQKRVTDNYYQRAKEGYFLGGSAPFGYELNKDKKFTPIAAQAEIVCEIYRKYGNENYSLGELARELNGKGVRTNRGKPFSAVAVRRILRNPVYAMADINVYGHLCGKGAHINAESEDFTGECGCTVYGKRSGRSKFSALDGEFVRLDPHPGLIPSALWLDVQRRLDENLQTAPPNKGSSWLSGIVKCSDCGYAVTPLKGKNGSRYLTCGGKKLGVCKRKRSAFTFDDIEAVTLKTLKARIKEAGFTDIEKNKNASVEFTFLLKEKEKLSEKISAAALALINEKGTVAEHLKTEIVRLDGKLKKILARIDTLRVKEGLTVPAEKLKAVCENLENWDKDKLHAIALLYIDRVYITSNSIRVDFKI